MGTPKKEIDKEYLFNLLMPTAASDLPEDLPAAPAPSAAARTPAPEGAGLSALGSGVKVRPARELMLVNLNERLVADRLGISRSYVSRIEKKAISKLKQAFREAGVSD